VLAPDTPSFLAVPDTSMVLPVEEVIRGYLISRSPDLEGDEHHLFRFSTAEARVLVPSHSPEGATGSGDAAQGSEEDEDETRSAWDLGPSPRRETLYPPSPASSPGGASYEEVTQSIVLRVQVRKSMPETLQAQLIRALERQVTFRQPLVGWSDLFAVDGPLEFSGIEGLLELRTGP
jgi:hypothetical protein